MRRIAIASLVAGLCVRAATGAELYYLDYDALSGKYVGPIGALVISGDLAPGDAAHLRDKILADPERFLARNALILASSAGDAGDAGEAMKIARLVQALHTAVSVGTLTGKCAGACFLIYAVADQRGTDGVHLVGSGDLADTPPDAASTMRQFLTDNNVAEDLVERVLQPSRRAAAWLSDEDELRLGARSPSFVRYLVAHCAWDDALEHAVITGQRPLVDLQPMWACRSRAIDADARQALRLPRKNK